MLKAESNDSSELEVLHVLLLLQGTMLLLSGVAMLLFTGGNPLAWPLTLGGPLFLFVLAAGTVRRWRWVRRATLIVQTLTLLAFALSLLLGLIAALDFSLNLLTIITNVALPISVITLARRTPAAAGAIAPGAESVQPAGSAVAA